MSVSAAEMAKQDQEQAPSSKKRKHTDEERAERKKKKKQKHAPIEAEVAEVEDSPTVNKTKENKKGADVESVPPTSAQQEGGSDIELPDVEQDSEIPATGETPVILKKRRKRKDLDTSNKVASPAPETTEKEDIELPDTSADMNGDTFATPPLLTNGIGSTSQPTLPSDSIENTPFRTTRASLYVPCPAISLSTALPSLISTHLTPLLLTYYGPVSGVVLSITDVSVSSHAASEAGKPLQLQQHLSSTSTQYALCADDFGVSFTWLTGTFTSFRPTLNTTLSGYINIASEGFIGLVLYNYFQVGIAKSRIPRSWRWTAPGGPKPSKKQPKKGRIRDSESVETENTQTSLTTIPNSQGTLPPSQTSPSSTSTGHWTKADGTLLKESDLIEFRVVDIDVVPQNARDSARLGLQIEGTLLAEEEETKLLEEEKTKFEQAQNKAYGRTDSPGLKDEANMMSGGLGREGSAATQTQRHRVAY
jgi:DNA-directed RNA polymerase I subunit RPA43